MKTQISVIFFIIAFLLIYGSLHYYFYRKFRSAVTLSQGYNHLILALLLLMFLAPLLVQVSVRYEGGLLSTLLSYIGYTWMAVLFLFFSMHLLIDACKGLINILSLHLSPVLLELKPGNRSGFVVTLMLAAAINAYGFTEAEKIRVEHITLQTEKLPPGILRLRVVQLTDIHFSAINGVKMARKIVEMTGRQHPDIIVSTGDLIDRGLREKESVEKLFRSLKAPYGKYAVTGNHEFYGGVNQALDFTKKAGFKTLRDKGLTAGDVVNIVGVDDPTARRFGFHIPLPESRVLKQFHNNKLTILLKHQPRVNKECVEMFDLQLSGHTHNGQIFPFRIITSLFFPYNNGLFQLDRNSYLYVSSGTGTWGPPVRFLSPPEITVIEFQGNDSPPARASEK